MRLIDVMGTSDVPYEQTTLIIDDGCIVAVIPNGNRILMAEYSSIDIAKKALSKMWRAYQRSEAPSLDDVFSNNAVNFFQFPIEDHM